MPQETETLAGGAWRHSEAYVRHEGVEYTPEQWWRKQVLERLDEIVKLLRGGKP